MFAVGAIASGINAVAGGGSLISFPYLVLSQKVGETLTLGTGLSAKIANATNSVGLFPGSMAGGMGFSNLIKKSGPHLKRLLIPTTLGSIAGAYLLLQTSDKNFAKVIPVLIFLAATLLWLQPKVRELIGSGRQIPVWLGLVVQFLVSVYGGFFGAGMGIMMLACFSFYMEGNVHELNAIKNWLALLINFTCSIVFVVKGLVVWSVAPWIVAGSLVGGFFAARISQRFDPAKLRKAISIYGFGMALWFAYQAHYFG